MNLYFWALAIIAAQRGIEAKRDGKLLSIFNIVTFPNDPCDAGSKNGTCYTKEECSNKGGTNDGSCASGYGVCCSFTARCGQTLAENNTYFESGGSETGGCTYKVCPCSDNICQLRLDFETFTITGPSTLTTSFAKATGNIISKTAAKEISTASKCLTDTFTVTNPNGASPPAICGTNSGEHMYVDSSKACNDLNFILGQTGQGTTLASRSWSVRVTQIECGSNSLAPEGCTQYFYGQDTGQLKTFNYDGGYHLSSQNQVQCIRREKGNCKICYSTSTRTDLDVSGNAATKFDTVDCCWYKADGMGTMRDCVIIPSLSKTTGAPLKFGNFCGRGGLATKATNLADDTAIKTLCTKRQPFTVTFNSDEYEFTTNEAAKGNKGYKLYYFQSSNGC